MSELPLLKQSKTKAPVITSPTNRDLLQAISCPQADKTATIMKEHKAYHAMFYFLDERYKHLPSESLGTLLSEMSLDLWADGSPADPAIVAAWERAVARAEQDMPEAAGHPPTLRKAS